MTPQNIKNEINKLNENKTSVMQDYNTIAGKLGSAGASAKAASHSYTNAEPKMSLNEIFHQFLTDIHHVRWQEWDSTVTQIMSVCYSRKINILVLPTGIIGVILAAWVYFFIAEPPLYGDGILNLYYFGMSVYVGSIGQRPMKTTQQSSCELVCKETTIHRHFHIYSGLAGHIFAIDQLD